MGFDAGMRYRGRIRMLQLTAVVWSGMSNVVKAKGTQWLTALVKQQGIHVVDRIISGYVILYGI